MKFDSRLAFVAGLALASLGASDVASAMPAAPLQHVIATPSENAPTVENIYYYRIYRYYRPYYRHYHYRYYYPHYRHYYRRHFFFY